MRAARIALTKAATLSMSGPVMAQSVRVYSLRSVVSPGNHHDQSDNVSWTGELKSIGVARPTPMRFARARKAAVLINASRCSDASQLAVRAKDDKLASTHQRPLRSAVINVR